jgi:chitinase
MYPEEIPAAAYTDLNFGFALIDPNTFSVAPMSDGDPALYSRLAALKNTNPPLEVGYSSEDGL